MMQLTLIKNSNQLFKSMRLFQKERQNFVVMFSSSWDKQSDYINNVLEKSTIEQELPILLVDSFETPELFSLNERNFSCVKVPACYFYKYDNRIREYRIYKEVLPSRILEGLGVFE